MDKSMTIEDLFNLLRPAFLVSERMFKFKKLDYIKKEDMWNYLRSNKWKKKNISISEMVHDIINISIKDVLEYVNSNIHNMKRVIG